MGTTCLTSSTDVLRKPPQEVDQPNRKNAKEYALSKLRFWVELAVLGNSFTLKIRVRVVMIGHRRALSIVIAWNMAVFYVATLPIATAVQIQIGDGTGNTFSTPPLNDPGVGNVGSRNGNSGVYIGDGWVLTAGHVPGGNMVFGGTIYDWVPSSDTLLTNPVGQGLTEFADLRMFRLSVLPPLPSLKISSTAPQLGNAVVMAGNGKDREPSLTGWQLNTVGQNTIWTETTPAGTPGTKNGYKYLSSNSLRWGTNSVALDTPPGVITYITVQGVDSAAFATTFDNLPGTSEAQAATNDSGGGVFRSKNGSWELAGIMIAIGADPGQPVQTSVFGNRTYSAALSVYSTQIQDRIMSSRVDVNGDATVDGLDLAVVYSFWTTSSTVADFDRSGTVDGADLALLYQFWTGDAGTESVALGHSNHAAGGIPDSLLYGSDDIPRITIGAVPTGQLANVPEPTPGNITFIWGIVSYSLRRRTH